MASPKHAASAASTAEEDFPFDLKPCNELLKAAALGDEDDVRRLLKNKLAPAWYQDDASGQSALMAASAEGHVHVVQALLEYGAPWNATDRQGRCAGNFAIEAGHQDIIDMLINAGTTAELIFYALEKRKEDAAAPRQKSYLEQKVRYQGDDLLDDDDRGVMMKWEKPLMEIHAQIICEGGGDVLNVGFGLGLVDGAIQDLGPRSHTIIEAHPQVLQRMREAGWMDKPNVTVLEGRWQDVLEDLNADGYDGVFFDTFDDVGHMSEFHEHLPRLLRKGGVYSYFNGIQTENVFFQAVASQVIQMQLAESGFHAEFHPCAVDSGDEDTWKDCSFRYFHGDEYYIPIIKWA